MNRVVRCREGSSPHLDLPAALVAAAVGGGAFINDVLFVNATLVKCVVVFQFAHRGSSPQVRMLVDDGRAFRQVSNSTQSIMR